MDSLGVFTSPKRRSQPVAHTVFMIASHVALWWDWKSWLLIFDNQLLFWLWRATLCGCSRVLSLFMHAYLSVHSSLYCTRACSLEEKKNGLERILCSLVCCIWRFFFVIFVSVSLPVFPCPPALFVPPPPPTCYLLINVICFQQPPVELLFDIPAANQLDVMDTFCFCFKWLS